VFGAGDDRCRGLIGSSNVICGVVNCGVPCIVPSVRPSSR